MTSFLRKLRGIVSIGLTWGTLWGFLMFLTGLIIGIVDPDSIDPGESPVVIGAILGGMGLVSGALFGILLSVAEGRKTIAAELSVVRAGVWGAIAAAAPLLLGPGPNGMVVILCPLGAAFAAGSVALARRADRREPERLPLGDSPLLPK